MSIANLPGIQDYRYQQGGGYDMDSYYRDQQRNLDFQTQANQLRDAKNQEWQRVNPELMQSQGQQQAEQWYSQRLKNPTTYNQPLSAQNEYTQSIKNQLDQYMNRGTPAEYGLAGEEYRKTLQGEYDPSSGQYYEGMRQAMDLNLSDTLNRYGRQQYLKGNLRSTTTDTGQARMIAENTASQNQLLGQLALQERQNRLGAAGSAVGLGQIYDQRAGQDLSTLTGTSDYLRGLSQAEKDREYNAYLQQQQYQQSLADTLYKTPQTYMFPQYQLLPKGTV